MEKAKIVEELRQMGLEHLQAVAYNLSVEELIEEAIKNNEGVLTETGAFRVETGKYTGRSPKDR